MTEAFMPGIKNINGHTYVKVKDLAEEWDTTTSTILATGKPQQIPSRFRRTIDRQAWVSVEGLAYRLNKTKGVSNLVFQLKEFLQRFPVRSYKQIGPLMETVHEKNGGTTTIYRSTFQDIDVPSSEELQSALDNRQVIYRYKNDGTQVLAQTLSNYLDTRTSSLLAVNKKQGVPGKFIHREWKRTWVDLEGLKVRVAHTEHGSALLKGLNWVVQYFDGEGKTFDQLVETMKQFESAKSKQKKQQAKTETQAKRCGTREKPCEVAVEANKRAVHNTERLNKLTRDEAALENLIFKYRDAGSIDLATQSKRLDMFADRLHRIEKGDKSGGNVSKLEKACHNQLTGRVHNLEDRVAVIEAGDKQAAQAMAEGKTPLDALSQRVSSMVTHTDRLDGKTDGLESRVSVVEDTSKWLSWSLATLLSLRFVGFMLRLLKRK